MNLSEKNQRGSNHKEKSLSSIDEFEPFEDVLSSQGIETAEDFIGLVGNNPEGIKELLEVDDEELKKLIESAKNSLSEEELKEIETAEIKEVGKDYKLGLRFKEDKE